MHAEASWIWESQVDMVCAGASRAASLIGAQGVWMTDKRVYGGFGISPMGSGEHGKWAGNVLRLVCLDELGEVSRVLP